ncbi:MAG: ABC transporter permease [Acidobacteria bacterium]|nr:ABC transporter permease [Acidobacteriota bacterium]MCA1640868.1 ABC transporter permease [Acidobacteriota bacterium]
MSVKTSDGSSREDVSAAPAPPAPAHGAAAATPGGTRAHAHSVPRVVIESEETGVHLNLGDLWAYRELLYFLTWRDVKVRYKQTLMGAAWVVIQPLMLMLIVTLVFNRFARLGAGALPYPLFAYSGLLLWTFFSTAVSSSTHSLTSNSNLITKVYFPRLFVPAAAVAAGLVDLSIASVILAALMIYYGVALTISLALAPLFVALLTLFALGVGTLVSALTVKYRDLRHALPFLLQFWMFASPVIYPTTIVPGRWRWLLVVNPLTGVIEGFRASLTGEAVDRRAVAVSAITAVIVCALALYVFRRTEDTFADVI